MPQPHTQTLLFGGGEGLVQTVCAYINTGTIYYSKNVTVDPKSRHAYQGSLLWLLTITKSKCYHTVVNKSFWYYAFT
jgi:hypothetical protein